MRANEILGLVDAYANLHMIEAEYKVSRFGEKNAIRKQIVQALGERLDSALTDERTRYLIEVKSVLPGWDEAGPAHSKLEHALEALPYYRKDTRKDLRVVRERRATVHVDSVTPPAPKE